MNKFDPDEVFINNFGRRIKKSGTKVDFDPLISRCALLDNCFCTKDSDCGDSQICTTISGYSNNVCKTKNEIPLLFSQSILPKKTDLLYFFSTKIGTLATSLLKVCTGDALRVTLGNITDNALGTYIDALGTAARGTLKGTIGGGY